MQRFGQDLEKGYFNHEALDVTLSASLKSGET